MSGGTVIQLPNVIVSKTVTVASAGTPVALGAQKLLSGVTVKAHPGNTSDKIFVGGSGIDNTGYFVSKADGIPVFIEVEELGNIFIDAETDGDQALIVGA